MKLLILLFACVALASAATTRSEQRDNKRFIAAVANWFVHAGNQIKDGLTTAGHAIEGAASTAGHAIAGAASTAGHAIAGAASTAGHAIAGAAVTAGHAIEGAAVTVGNGIKDAALAVKDGVVDAAHSVADFANQAKVILTPILNQVAATVGPIAQTVFTSAVNEIIQQAPEMLSTLGQIGVEKLVTTLITSAAAGKRDVSEIEHLREAFGNFVQHEVNTTVNDVHKAVALTEKFNADLKKEVNKLEFALQTGADVETAARHFFFNVLTAVQPLIDGGVFEMDVSCFDNVLTNAINRFENEMRTALHRSSHKRGLLMDLAGDVAGLIHTGEQHISNLISGLHNLAQSILAPTLGNVKNIAQTLLNNVGSVTQSLVTKAMSLLAPFQQQLGPLFQQVQTLAGNIGLHQ